MPNMMKIILLMSTFLFGVGFDIQKSTPTFLKPDEAFKVTAIKKDGVIEATIKLGDKIHIYDDSIHIKVIKPKSFKIKELQIPKAHKLDGDMVHDGEVLIKIPTSAIESKVNGDYTIAVEFEGCSDSGICYQPQRKELVVNNPNITKRVTASSTQKKQSASDEKSGVFEKIGSLADVGSSAKIEDVLSTESSWFIVLLFFIFGLLLSLTPCIFPMIPILSSIIVAQSNDGKSSASRAFFTSLVYVLSMAVTYTVVGLIAGLLGADIQAAMQNPWVLSIFAAIFVALAFSLFGYYEIALPHSIQSRLTKVSDGAQGKGILGTAIMGLLSALIVGPCVAPPLGGAILFISHTGDALLGGIALFVMSLGMGMPLLLVGVGAGKFMPKPGGWMSKVSQVFGIVMLGLAIFMIDRILPDSVTLILWAMLFMGTAIYLGLFDGKKPVTIGGYIGKLFAIAFLLYGATLFVGGVSGAKSLFAPLERFTSQTTITTSDIVQKNHTGYSIERLIKEVKISTKPVVVDFGKESCAACLELEKFTFPAPAVQEQLKNFTFIKIDLTKNTDEDRALLKKYELFGTPNIIFFDADNNFLPDKTLTGFIKPEVFAEHLKGIVK